MDKKLIEQILARLDRIEKIVLASGSKPRSEAKRERSSSEGLPAHILNLRDEQFLKSLRQSARSIASSKRAIIANLIVLPWPFFGSNVGKSYERVPKSSRRRNRLPTPGER